MQILAGLSKALHRKPTLNFSNICQTFQLETPKKLQQGSNLIEDQYKTFLWK